MNDRNDPLVQAFCRLLDTYFNVVMRKDTQTQIDEARRALIVEYQRVATTAPAAGTAVFPANEPIPCDVAVAPATVFGAGCDLSSVLATIRQRKSTIPPPHFRSTLLKRVLPPEFLADVAELIARDVAQLQDRGRPLDAMRVTVKELEGIVRARLAEEMEQTPEGDTGSCFSP